MKPNDSKFCSQDDLRIENYKLVCCIQEALKLKLMFQNAMRGDGSEKSVLKDILSQINHVEKMARDCDAFK
jgi:hypothetical protein